MKIWKTAIVFVIIGLLLSFSRMSNTATDGTVVLTEDNHIVFAGEVTDESVALAQVKLAEISAELGKNDVIYLVIDSPGGSVTAGNRFIDFASSIPQKVKTICLFCASMGYHMFQSLDERLVYESSELMSHRVRIGGLAGQVPGEAVSRLKDIIATSNRMDEKVANRIGVSLEAYQKSIYDELWLSGTDAVKAHHADRIAKIGCSKNLAKGKKSEVVQTFLGPVKVITSTCPLISGFLDIEFQRGGKFRSLDEAKEEVRKVRRIITTKY